MSFIKTYLDLFAATPKRYAIRREWEGSEGTTVAYMPSDYDGDKEAAKASVEEVVTSIGSQSYGEEAVKAHLMGDFFLGVYPIHEDSTVRFFALTSIRMRQKLGSKLLVNRKSF